MEVAVFQYKYNGQVVVQNFLYGNVCFLLSEHQKDYCHLSEVTFLLKGCFFTAFLTTILKGANIFCWLISLLKGKVTGKFVLSRFSSSAGSPQFSFLDIFLGKVLSFFYLVPEPGRSGPGAPFFFCWYRSQVGVGQVRFFFALCLRPDPLCDS